MDQIKLTEQEMQLWLMYKETFKTVFARIVKDNYDKADISDGDYMVLDLLTRSENGQLRQQILADNMGWSKSRLSHHLVRMEKRGLIEKRPITKGNGIQVVITSKGTAAFETVLPVSAAGIKRYFLDLLTEQDKEWIAGLAARVKETL